MIVKVEADTAQEIPEVVNPDDCKIEAVMNEQQRRLVEFTEDGFHPGLLRMNEEEDVPFRALIRLQVGFLDYTPYEWRDGDPEMITVPISALHSVQWERFRESEPGKLMADLVRRILGQFMVEYQNQLSRRVDELEGSHLTGPDVYLVMARALGEIDAFFAPTGHDMQDLEKAADLMRCHIREWQREHNIIDIRHKFQTEDHDDEEGEDE